MQNKMLSAIALLLFAARSRVSQMSPPTLYALNKYKLVHTAPAATIPRTEDDVHERPATYLAPSNVAPPVNHTAGDISVPDRFGVP